MPPAIPAHVPRELVVDFDFMNLPGHRDDVHVAWKRAVDNAPDIFFGDGPHRCPGSFLARQELRIFLEEWLKRIPDFRIKPGAKAETSSGMVNGVLSLPLVWDVK